MHVFIQCFASEAAPAPQQPQKHSVVHAQPTFKLTRSLLLPLLTYTPTSCTIARKQSPFGASLVQMCCATQPPSCFSSTWCSSHTCSERDSNSRCKTSSASPASSCAPPLQPRAADEHERKTSGDARLVQGQATFPGTHSKSLQHRAQHMRPMLQVYNGRNCRASE